MSKRSSPGWSGAVMLLSFVIGFLVVAVWRR